MIHQFTLAIDSDPDDFDKVGKRLYGISPDLDDLTVIRLAKDVIYLDFDRENESREAAIASAIKTVESTKVKVVKIEE